MLGTKPNNFKLTLLQTQSTLSKEIVKDSYIFAAGAIRANLVEKDIEKA